jgi:hypothetical protein
MCGLAPARFAGTDPPLCCCAAAARSARSFFAPAAIRVATDVAALAEAIGLSFFSTEEVAQDPFEVPALLLLPVPVSFSRT